MAANMAAPMDPSDKWTPCCISTLQQRQNLKQSYLPYPVSDFDKIYTTEFRILFSRPVCEKFFYLQ